MTELLKKAKECAVYLGLVWPETGGHCGLTDDSRFLDWRKAVYDDPDFLYEGDYFAVYEDCRGKDPAGLNEEQVRACITFLLRQMRCASAPYPCLTSGELLGFLNRWIEMKEEEK